MKKYVICSTIAGLCLLSYLLFEPIFTYNWGWQRLPDTIKQTSLGIQDSSYIDAITFSKAEVSRFSEMGIPALSIAVGVDTKIIWSEARGYVDIDDSITATSKTSFRIGSVSKAVTSVALARLLENHQLQLEDRVVNYLPKYQYTDVTIKQLASHTSGIRNYALCLCMPVWEYYSNDRYSTVSKSLEMFVNDPLLFEPGTDFSYSSYNYNLLSAVLETSYGSNFNQLMHSEVFQPLHMNYTTFDYADSVITDRAKFYDVTDGEYTTSFKVDNSNKWAGGGIISTPSDLVKMGNSLLSGEFINQETFQTITTPVTLTNGEINEQNYALGWRNDEMEISGFDEKITIIHHGGKAVGSTALLLLVPKYNLTLAVMINRSVRGFPLFDLAKPIIGAFIHDRLSLR